MPRPARTDFPGAWHHVVNRGARRSPIFREEVDCRSFLDAVAESVERDGIEVHAYALMPNHFHLLVRSPHGTLSQAMRRLGWRYTSHLNDRHGWDGPVFKGRFHSRLVVQEEHRMWLLAYLHLNPVRSRLVKLPEEALWTSHRAYTGLDVGPPWLRMDELSRQVGGAAAVAGFIRDVRLGRERMPADLQPSRWTAVPEGVQTPRRPVVPASRLDELFVRIERITGVERGALLVRVRGPRANPARRFAAWALAHSTPLRHADVGCLLGMSASQAANAIRRARLDGDPRVTIWRSGWTAEEACNRDN